MLLELLSTYSLVEVIIFIVAIAAAVKAVISFYDWSKKRLREAFDKGYQEEKEEEKIKRDIKDLNKFFEERKKVDDNFEKVNKTFEKINQQIEVLIESDKDDIKSYIVERHHHFCYDKKCIDDHSLDCIEKRYEHYVAEGGNSYVEDLMKDLRKLPKDLELSRK